jgi:magnesium chelatase family protein
MVARVRTVAFSGVDVVDVEAQVTITPDLPAFAVVLSARGYHRVLRVARTLADLEGAATVARHHVAEALSYRRPFHLPDSAGG